MTHAPASPPKSIFPITGNERAWIKFIRAISDRSDPGITLRRIQQLRILLLNKLA